MANALSEFLKLHGRPDCRMDFADESFLSRSPVIERIPEEKGKEIAAKARL